MEQLKSHSTIDPNTTNGNQGIGKMEVAQENNSGEIHLAVEPCERISGDEQLNSERNILANTSHSVKLEEMPDPVEKIETNRMASRDSRDDDISEIKQDTIGELDHSSTNLSSLSESLVEITNSTIDSLVAYGASDEGSESEDSSSSSSAATSESETESSESDSSDGVRAIEGNKQNRKGEVEKFTIPKPLRTKKELMLKDLPQVPYVDFRLGDNEEVSLLGEVSSVIGQLVVVASNKEMPALNEDTVLFKEDRHPIGVVFELFGPVPNPFYTVRFNSVKDITDLGLVLGSNIYFAPKQEEITNYVFVKELRAMKGSDASWANDNEPPQECVDYSDDEQERSAKKGKNKTMNEKRKVAARRRDESDSSSDAQSIGRSQQQPNRQGDMNSNHSRGYHHHNRGPTQRHYGQQPPRPPFNHGGPRPPWQNSPQGPIRHPRGPSQGHYEHHPTFNHGGPRPPWQNSPQGPIRHPVGPPQGHYEHQPPHPSFNQSGPHPPRQRFPQGQMRHPAGPPQGHYEHQHPAFNHSGPHPTRQRFPQGPGGPCNQPMQQIVGPPNIPPHPQYPPHHQYPPHPQLGPPMQIPPNVPPPQGGMIDPGNQYPPPYQGDGPRPGNVHGYNHQGGNWQG